MENKNEKIISLLQLAFKANKIALGHDAVIRLLIKKKVFLLLLAKDLSENSISSISKHIKNNEVEIIKWGNKDIYFQIFNKYTGIVAILDLNFKSGIKNHFTNSTKEG